MQPNSAFLLTLYFVTLIACSKVCTQKACSYDDVIGLWIFNVGGSDPSCPESYLVTNKLAVNILYPDRAIDLYGNEGKWTMIYNQGFEVFLQHRKWFVPLDDSCKKSKPFWSHDALIRQWKYFTAVKTDKQLDVRYLKSTNTSACLDVNMPIQTNKTLVHLDKYFQINEDFIAQINKVQKSWTATVYTEYTNYKLLDLIYRKGGPDSLILKYNNFNKVKTSSSELLSNLGEIPEQFDWRTPSPGMPSPITPVRDQGRCGSAYAFASVGAFESRIRLATSFKLEPILSPQDVVDCNPYSHGCSGGLPYLVVGKYAEDYGFIEETCSPYRGDEGKYCTSRYNCPRYYTTNYRYIGGFYGATTEELMKIELVNNGPFPVSLQASDDFLHYKSGIYHYTGLKDSVNRFDPFVYTNHTVLLVGYGVDKVTNEYYWILKNSWGDKWGEKGYFRLKRGTNECGVESAAVSFDIVL